MHRLNYLKTIDPLFYTHYLNLHPNIFIYLSSCIVKGCHLRILYNLLFGRNIIFEISRIIRILNTIINDINNNVGIYRIKHL